MKTTLLKVPVLEFQILSRASCKYILISYTFGLVSLRFLEVFISANKYMYPYTSKKIIVYANPSEPDLSQIHSFLRLQAVKVVKDITVLNGKSTQKMSKPGPQLMKIIKAYVKGFYLLYCRKA